MLGARMLMSAGGANYYTVILASAPLAYWRMNESSGALVDVIGGNNLTPNSLTYGKQAIVKGDASAIGFDGSTSYADGGDILDPAVGEDFSWEIWMRSTASIPAGSAIRLMDKRGQGAAGSFPGVSISPDLFSGQAGWGNTFIEDTAGNFIGGSGSAFAGIAYHQNDGDPHHIVLVWDSSTGTASLFIDGSLQASQTNSALIGADLRNARSFRIGAANTDGQFYSGDLDAAAVYDRALTASSILNHYKAGVGA